MQKQTFAGGLSQNEKDLCGTKPKEKCCNTTTENTVVAFAFYIMYSVTDSPLFLRRLVHIVSLASNLGFL